MSKRNIFLISLIVLLIAGGALAGYFVLQVGRKKAKSQENIPKQTQEEPINSSASTPSEKEGELIKIYFGKDGGKHYAGDICEEVAPMNRIVPQTESVEEMAIAAINEMIKGPTEEEKKQGYYLYGIPSKEDIERHKKAMAEKELDPSGYDRNLKIESLEIKNNIAYIDFNIVLCASDVEPYERCTVSLVKSALINTLRQFFPELKDVVITVEGREWPLTFSEMRKLEFESGKTSVFIETAQPGESISDLAERALDKYLKQVSHVEEIELTKRQKKYIVDYLCKKNNPHPLKVGEPRKFSADFIKEAIDASRIIISISGTSFFQGDEVTITYPKEFGYYGGPYELFLVNDSNPKDYYGLFTPDFEIKGDEVIYKWTISANEQPGSYYIAVGDLEKGIRTPTFTISASTRVHPQIVSVTPSVVSLGEMLTIEGKNLDPLGGEPSIGWFTHSHIFVNITNSNGQTGILWEGGSQGGNTVSEDNKIKVTIPSYVLCKYSTEGLGGSCPEVSRIPITSGKYSLSISVDGRGTSNSVEIVIR